MATIIGTETFDTLVGTADDDLIEGRGGSDMISGGGGADVLRGGSGSDQLEGGAGDDLVEGGADPDYLYDDVGGSDILKGEEGDDTIYVSRGVYDGSTAKLRLMGGAGDDSIFYADYNRSTAEIDGGDGDDVITLDRIQPEAIITFGAGRDQLVLRSLLSLDVRDVDYLTITDFTTGPIGDRIEWLETLGTLLTGWDQSRNPFGTGHLWIVQAGDDSILYVDFDGAGPATGKAIIRFENADANTFTFDNLDGYAADGTASPALTLTGGATRDTLTGNGGDDTIDGGDGDDVLQGRGGDDLLRGGLGRDELRGSVGDDRLFGEAGDDTLGDSNGGNDAFDGGDGDDSIFLYRLNRSLDEVIVARGGAGNDRLSAWSYATGSVLLDGGAGDDVITLWTNDNNQTMLLGDGSDTIDLDNFQTFGMERTTRIVTDFATGASGDTVQLRDVLTNSTDWTGETDPFASGELALVQRGADTVLLIRTGGRFGRPPIQDLLIFQGRAPGDFVAHNFGGFSPDGTPVAGLTLTGTPGADTLTGGFGADSLDGLNGDDRLSGLAGEDTLRGGAGQDTLNGGAGDDVLEGGAGDDIFEFGGGGSDVVRGEGGNDFVFFYRNFEGPVEQVTIDTGADDDTIYYQNFNPGGVTIDAGTGADHVRLIGSRGTIDVTVGAGADLLDLNDHYVSLLGEFVITVRDFDVAADRLIWADYLAGELLTWDKAANPFATGHIAIAQVGADVEIVLDRDAGAALYAPQRFMVLQNVALATLTKAQFDGYPPDGSDLGRIVTGTAAAETLIGGMGDDAIDARAGDDVLIGGAGADRLTGGAGVDTFTGTLADMAGDTLTDFAVGERILLTDAVIDGFRFQRAGNTLTLPGGAAGVSVFLPAGANPMLVTRAASGGGVELIAAGHEAHANDFNADGHGDLLWRHAPSGAFSTWDGQGNALANSFVENSYFSAAQPVTTQAVASLDWNGDGRSDMLWRDAAGTFGVWAGGPDGFVRDATTIAGIGRDWSVTAVGDFSGDGRDDLMFRNVNGALTVWQSAGAGFTPNVFVSFADPSWVVAGVMDFDGDGRDDIVWRNQGAGLFSIWTANGEGGATDFAPNTYVDASVDGSWSIAALADFNGDGKDDLLWRNAGGIFTEWQSTGSGFRTNVYANGTVTPDWAIAQAADMNGDGMADLLFRNLGDGRLTVWQSDGDGFIPNTALVASVSTDWALIGATGMVPLV